jgi:hypothetical protein
MRCCDEQDQWESRLKVKVMGFLDITHRPDWTVVSETSCFKKVSTIDNIQKSHYSSNTPSLESLGVTLQDGPEAFYWTVTLRVFSMDFNDSLSEAEVFYVARNNKTINE